jgi:hypothetical protein
LTQRLRRFVAQSVAQPVTEPSPPPSPSGERCELCGAALAPGHGHLVDLEERSLRCACRPCALLFVRPGAAHGRYRTVPDRYLHDPDLVITDGWWDSLQVPVTIAFFFRHEGSQLPVAFYPSPAGATESTLSLEAWNEVLASSPLLGVLEPDVEALLVRRRDDSYEAYLVPVDACYELVGLVRTTWRGFDGGDEARAAIDAFFDRVAARSRPVAVP